jgi:hypothetical protein
VTFNDDLQEQLNNLVTFNANVPIAVDDPFPKYQRVQEPLKPIDPGISGSQKANMNGSEMTTFTLTKSIGNILERFLEYFYRLGRDIMHRILF